MVNYNGRKIVYPFRYGALMTKGDKIGFSIMTAFWLVMMILSVSLGYLFNSTVDGWICFTLTGILFIILLVITLKFWLRDMRGEKEIAKWLTDENLFEATAVPYECDPKLTKTGYAYKHAINFENNGNSYQSVTADYDRLRNFYQAVKSEKGKEVTFLYSPKYGEIMVFENKQVK